MSIYALAYGIDPIEFLVEKILEEKEGRDLSHITLLLSHKRPRAYLYESLKKAIGSPFIPPRVLTLPEFVDELSALLEKPAKRLLGVEEQAWLLYKVVKRRGFGGSISSLDFSRFLPWGRLMALFFEEVELEMGDVSSFPYAEGGELLRQLLEDLGEIHRDFRLLLEERGFVTRGIRQRLLAERIGEIELEGRFFVAGFYALTASESRILKRIHDFGGVFVWEVGEEVPRLYRERWMEEWGVEPEFVGAPKEQKVSIHAAQDVHQEAEVLRRLVPSGVEDPRELAVVVPNPSNLIPFIYSLPDTYVNITAGYPLKKTAVYTFIELSLKTVEEASGKGAYPLKRVLELLMHPVSRLSFSGEEVFGRLAQAMGGKLIPSYVSLGELDGFLKRLSLGGFHGAAYAYLRKLLGFLGRLEESRSLLELADVFEGFLDGLLERMPREEGFSLQREAVLRLRGEALKRVKGLLFSREEMDRSSLFSIFLHTVKNYRIPFEGEPLKGIQVMGLLEARLLTFKKAIVLDVNEGVLPSHEDVNPLVPDHLRKAMGLSDRERREEIIRYYFERLVRSSEEVHIVYQDGVSGDDKKVRSRFVERIIWEWEKKEGRLLGDRCVDRFGFTSFKVDMPRKKGIEKDEDLKKAVFRLIDRKSSGEGLSFSFLDTYITCPVRFYYSYVLGLDVGELKDRPDGGEVGRLVHAILEKFFRDSLGKPFRFEQERFKELVKRELDGLGDVLFPSWRREVLEKVILFRLEHYLNALSKVAGDIVVLSVEEDVSGLIGDYRFYCRIDRVDRRGDRIYILDYKTGSYPEKKIRVEELMGFELEGYGEEGLEAIRDRISSLQLPIYQYVYAKSRRLPLSKIVSVYVPLGDAGTEGWEPEVFPFSSDPSEFLDAKLSGIVRFVLNHMVEADYFYAPSEKERARVCRLCEFGELCSFRF